jgi:hypothetical protein
MKFLSRPPTLRNPGRRPRAWLIAGTAAVTVLMGLTPAIIHSPGASASASVVAPSVAQAGPGAAYQSPGTPSPSVAGATTPFVTYQAPEGVLGGGASVVSLTSAPTSEFDSAQGEASGHAYVQLTGVGQSVQWTNQTGAPISFINVRASIPDSSTGGGLTATLDLYVNGVFRQALSMNSIQSWEYEGNNNYNGSDENPADGDPRNFWDEFHAFVSGSPIPAGATFSLQEDSTNTASFYWINSIDLWNAPAPLAQPANSVSITSCGAVADNTATNGTAAPGATDSTADIQNCINQAAAAGEILWIPQGTFYLVGTASLVVNNITVEGAGYLYSEVYRDVPLPNSTPLGSAFQCYSCHLENFHIDSDAMSRAEVDGGGGAEDTTGTNWVISGMWVQHVESSLWASGTGGIAENNLFTVIFADGCNLNNVSLTGTSGSNLTATNNFIRGTGDDGMAINSVAYNTNGSTTTTYTAMSDITMTHNTVIAPWGGKGIGIYGGSGHVVENNYLADTARYIGLGVGRFGVNGSDMLGATVSGNVVVRSGGNAYFQGQPALQVGNGGDGQNTGTVTDATVTDNTIINPVYDGVNFSTSTDTILADNTITNPWRNGIVISPQYYPAPTGNAALTGNTVTGLESGMSAYANDSTGFTSTQTGNSWQNTTPEAPYGGTPATIPGTVQAENYDTGGQAVAYNVTATNGTGNSYRSDGVDLEATTDTGGGYDLGWTGTGQWFRYTVNVATAGTYTVSFRVASANGVTDGLHLTNTSGDDLTGTENIPATGSSQTWTTITDTVTLPAGQQTLVLDQDNPGWNINYLTIASTSSSAVLSTSPTSVSFGNQTDGTTSAAHSVTISNTGGAAATISSITTAAPFAQTNTCGSSLAAGASCTASVTFAPSSAGAASGTLTINASGATDTVPLSGTGTAPGPVLTVTPASLSFPSTVVGSPASAQSVTVGNSGTTAATVSGVSVSGPFSETNNCSSIAVGGSCTVNVVFTPTAGGTQTGTLTVTSNANNSPTTASLSGSGISSSTNLALAGTITASGSESGFPATNANDGNTSTYWEGPDGSGYPQTLTANLGQSYPLGSVTLDLPPATAWSTRTETFSVLGSTNNSTWTTLVASANYTFNPSTGNTVSFSLPSGTSDQYLELDFSANTGWTAAQISEFEIFPGSGGTSPPPSATLSASPTSVSFGNQTDGTTSAAHSVTISNTGGAAATISSISTASPFAQTNTCGSSLAAGASCTASVTFAPSSAGAASGNVTISSNATNSTLTVALSGTGVAPGSATLSASPTSVSFGNQTDGTTSSAHSVTISNTGSTAASISSIAVGSGFAQSNTCGSSIAAGGTCTVSVTFSPTAVQAYSANLTVSSNATNSTLTVALSGTGTSSSSSTNLALNAPITASSASSGYPATNANDGNTSTYWEGTNGAWPTTLAVNLGAVDPITSAVIDLPPATAWSTRTQTLSVLGSTNDSTWTTLVSSATYTWNPSTGNTVTIALPTGTNEQYAELSFTANSVQNGAQVSELQVWGTSTALPDLALNAPITASSASSGYPATNANDGNTSTYWEGTNGAWPTTLAVNLGSSQTLGSLVIDLPPSTAWSTRTQTLSVLGSTNDSTWTTLVSSATYTWNPSTGNTVTISLPSGTTDQYLELSFTANSVQNGAQVSELYVYS